MGYKPHPRDLKPGPPLEGQVGVTDDIRVYQEVLESLGFLKHGDYRVGEYAEHTWDAVERCGKVHGIEPGHILGKRMHTILAPHISPKQDFRLAMAQADLKGGHNHRIAESAMWYHYYGPYAYWDGRPEHFVPIPFVPDRLDCSSFSVQSAISAGYQHLIPDIQGNTHSLVLIGHHVDFHAIQAGDWIFVNGPAGINSHMFVAFDGHIGVSHGHTGYPDIVSNFYYPIYAVRRLVAR